MKKDYLSASEAWADFYDRVRPDIWALLSRNDRRDINTAQRDYHGLRKDRKGQVIILGPERVAKLLERFAPGRYGVERVVRFWRTPDTTPDP